MYLLCNIPSLQNLNWAPVRAHWAASARIGHNQVTLLDRHDGKTQGPSWVDDRVAPGATTRFAWSPSDVRGREKDRATFFLTVGYDGSQFSGWESQGNVSTRTTCCALPNLTPQNLELVTGVVGQRRHRCGVDRAPRRGPEGPPKYFETYQRRP